MKHGAVVHHWWEGILEGVVLPDTANLTSTKNAETIRRIASRYDVVVTVAPQWHTVGTQVRDALRTAAAAQGRRITLLRYIGSSSLPWHDQSGLMSPVPVGSAVARTGQILKPDWVLRDASGQPLRSRIMDGSAWLPDYSNSELRAVSTNHVTSLAVGWDGVFIDEFSPSYAGFRQNTGAVDPRFPLDQTGWSRAYEEARRSHVRAVIASLSAAGFAAAANVSPETTPLGHFPTSAVSDNPGLRYPFLEVFGTGWSGQPTPAGSSDFATTQASVAWMRWCAGRKGVEPIVNVYSNDPTVLAFGAALFLAADDGQAILAGHTPVANDTYTVEPTWIPEYDSAEGLGRPLGPAAWGDVVRRDFERGCVVVNSSASTTRINLSGTYRAPGETAETVSRDLKPTTGVVLTGEPFGTYAVTSTPETVSSAPETHLKLMAGTWRAPAAATTTTNHWVVNPGMRANGDGWQAAAGCTLERLTSDAPTGSLPYLRLTVPAAGAGHVTNATLQPVTGTTPLELSAWIRSSMVGTVTFALDFYDAKWAYLRYDHGDVGVNPMWTRVSRQVNPPAEARWMGVVVKLNARAAARSLDTTGWLLTEGSREFFDGSTPATPTTTYAWAGPVNASASLATSTPAPTPEPTPSPTTSPSPSPTTSPTPTPTPTTSPSPSPTSSPTTQPGRRKTTPVNPVWPRPKR